MNRTFLSLILCTFLIAGCDGMGEEEPTILPGTLSLARVSSGNSADNVFDLGDLKNTKPFNFYLTNRGDTDIFEVTIESSNPLFEVDPASITLLRAGGELLLEQGLQVTPVHGTKSSGLGPTDPMPMGLNETELLIQAQTTNESGDTLSISTQARLHVNALLADVDLFDLSGAVPLDSVSGTISGSGTPLRLSRFEVEDGNVRLVNTGNAEIQLRIYNHETPADYEDVLIAPEEEIVVERTREVMVLRIDTNGTATYSEKLPIQIDGFIYIVVDFDRSPPAF